MMESTNNSYERNHHTYDALQDLRENQLEALKSLAILLLREVESLQKTPSNVNKVLEDGELCLYARTQQFEEELIRAVLIKTGGNQRQAAKLLGTKETTLNVKIKRYGIDEANQNSGSNVEKGNGRP